MSVKSYLDLDQFNFSSPTPYHKDELVADVTSGSYLFKIVLGANVVDSLFKLW